MSLVKVRVEDVRPGDLVVRGGVRYRITRAREFPRRMIDLEGETYSALFPLGTFVLVEADDEMDETDWQHSHARP